MLLDVHSKQLRSCWDSSYFTSLFLGKPPGGSLPVLSAHSFASNRQLALLESAEEGKLFQERCAGREDRSRDRCLQSGHATDQVTAPGKIFFINVIKQ